MPGENQHNSYFAVVARGLEALAAEELRRIGATQTEIRAGGVVFFGDLALLYRANLWLRTATRILRPLREFAAATPEMLYSQARRVRWEDFLNPQKTFAVYATIEGAGRIDPRRAAPPPPRKPLRPGQRPRPPERAGPPVKTGITHSQYAALKVKDAIADRLRREQGARPNVDTERPDFRIFAHFAEGRCTLSLDSSGESLHERGYRLQAGPAPLKETLAAGLVLMTGWTGETPLIDPMCGSGTIAIEAALIGLNIAPGLLRPNFGCMRWPDFDGTLWAEVEREARQARKPGLPYKILAVDIDPEAVAATKDNAGQAGVREALEFSIDAAEVLPRPEGPPGVLVVNPPYGERLGDEAELRELYRELGEHWKAQYAGWSAYVLAGNMGIAREIPLEALGKQRLQNGPIECRLLRFDVPEAGTGDVAGQETAEG